MFELYKLSQSEDNKALSQFNTAPFSYIGILFMKVYMIISQDNGLQEQVWNHGHIDLLDFILLAFYLRDYV